LAIKILASGSARRTVAAPRLALGERRAQWLAIRVADGVQLEAQAAFGASDAAGSIPF
jgi:hypothetical protein